MVSVYGFAETAQHVVAVRADSDAVKMCAQAIMQYKTTCFDPHLGHLHSRIIHNIKHNLTLDLYVDMVRFKSVLTT